MARLGLKQDVIEAIKKDPALAGEVASAIGVAFLTLPQVLKRNDVKLTSLGVIRILRKNITGSKDSDLVEEIEESTAA